MSSESLKNAAFKGDLREILRLLDSGAPIDETSGQWNALHAAIENQHFACVAHLIDRGANVEISNAGLTPLTHAVDIAIDSTWQREHRLGREPTEIIELLLRAGADPRPALDFARKSQSEVLIAFLEEALNEP